MQRPTSFSLDSSEDSVEDVVSLTDLLNVGTVKVNNRLYCNVTKESFDVSVLLSVRNGVKLKRATLKTEVVDISEYNVQEHRKTLELCNELAVLSPECVNLIRCFGFVGREDERDNFQFITKISEKTIFRFDQFISRIQNLEFVSTLEIMISNLWNAHDYLYRLGYFPDVDIDNIYVAADWSFKFDCDRAVPLHLVRNKTPFGWHLSRRFSFLLLYEDPTWLTPTAMVIYRSICRSRYFDDIFTRRSSNLRFRDFIQLNENGRKICNRGDPYQELKNELRRRLNSFITSSQADLQAEDYDPRSRSIKFKFLKPEFFEAALEEVAEHNRKWKKTPNKEDFMEMVLDACVIRMIPLVDAEIRNACDVAEAESSSGAWNELTPFEITFLSNVAINSVCSDAAVYL